MFPTDHPKFGQKRPETSPIPSSMHHHSQSSLGGQTTVMPAHMNSQSLQQMHQHSQQKSQNNLQAASNSRNNEQSFAAALRSLAKQQIDIKDEDMIQGDNKNPSNNPRVSEKEHEPSRQSNASRGIQYDNRPTDMRNLTSPQPPEKKVKFETNFSMFDMSDVFLPLQIPRLSGNANQQSSANIQSELLARSGFQPYRPDERHIHPAGAQYTMDSFSPFGPIPGMPTSKIQLSLSLSLFDVVLVHFRRSLQSSGLIIS